MPDYFYDENKTRYELYQSNGGKALNWLFFPGGPGGDSIYLKGLADSLELPGNVWLIDFWGNGSHVEDLPEEYNYDLWLENFVPTVKKFKNPIVVGHSFGGQLPLLFPEMEDLLAGCVILNSTPKLWMEEAVNYSKQFDLPDFSEAMQKFAMQPSPETFGRALEACAPYYFPKETLQEGRKMLLSLPFTYHPAGWWQNQAIAMNYSAKWIPQNIPTLIISGKYDCVCPYTLFHQDERFQRPNIKLEHIEDGGHLPWLENPAKVKEAFDQLTLSIML